LGNKLFGKKIAFLRVRSGLGSAFSIHVPVLDNKDKRFVRELTKGGFPVRVLEV